jgi:hypothetical protein
MKQNKYPEAKKEYPMRDSKTEPIQVSTEVLNKLRAFISDKKTTLKEVTEDAILNHIK